MEKKQAPVFSHITGIIANILSGATYDSKCSQTNIDIFDGSDVYSTRIRHDEPIDLPSAHLSITLALPSRLVDPWSPN